MQKRICPPEYTGKPQKLFDARNNALKAFNKAAAKFANKKEIRYLGLADSTEVILGVFTPNEFILKDPAMQLVSEQGRLDQFAANIQDYPRQIGKYARRSYPPGPDYRKISKARQKALSKYKQTLEKHKQALSKLGGRLIALTMMALSADNYSGFMEPMVRLEYEEARNQFTVKGWNSVLLSDLSSNTLFIDVGAGIPGIFRIAGMPKHAGELHLLDINSFIAAGLTKVHETFGRPSNITVSNADMAEYEFPNTAQSVAFFGLVHRVARERFNLTVSRLYQSSQSGSKVIINAPKDLVDGSNITGGDMAEMALSAGYTQRHQEEYSYLLWGTRGERGETQVGFEFVGEK